MRTPPWCQTTAFLIVPATTRERYQLRVLVTLVRTTGRTFHGLTSCLECKSNLRLQVSRESIYRLTASSPPPPPPEDGGET
jgi:hypothetical protein